MSLDEILGYGVFYPSFMGVISFTMSRFLIYSYLLNFGTEWYLAFYVETVSIYLTRGLGIIRLV